MDSGFVQARPNGDLLNTLVFVGGELIEVMPTYPTYISSSYDLAKGMGARFFFRRIVNRIEMRVEFDGYDIDAITPCQHGKAYGRIEPIRRFPNKDAAAMWAQHRGSR